MCFALNISYNIVYYVHLLFIIKLMITDHVMYQLRIDFVLAFKHYSPQLPNSILFHYKLAARSFIVRNYVEQTNSALYTFTCRFDSETWATSTRANLRWLIASESWAYREKTLRDHKELFVLEHLQKLRW